MLFQLPHKCRVFVAIKPATQWGWLESFANKRNYLLELIIWQNATPSKKRDMAAHMRKKPKPFIPDFMKSVMPPTAINKDIEQRTVDDIKSVLDLPRGV